MFESLFGSQVATGESWLCVELNGGAVRREEVFYSSRGCYKRHMNQNQLVVAKVTHQE